MFEVNQVVKGKVCGLFRIVSLRVVEVAPGVQLTVADMKELNPANPAQEGRGLIHLTTDCLLPV